MRMPVKKSNGKRNRIPASTEKDPDAIRADGVVQVIPRITQALSV